jgi:cell division protein FtsQ
MRPVDIQHNFPHGRPDTMRQKAEPQLVRRAPLQAGIDADPFAAPTGYAQPRMTSQPARQAAAFTEQPEVAYHDDAARFTPDAPRRSAPNPPRPRPAAFDPERPWLSPDPHDPISVSQVVEDYSYADASVAGGQADDWAPQHAGFVDPIVNHHTSNPDQWINANTFDDDGFAEASFGGHAWRTRIDAPPQEFDHTQPRPAARATQTAVANEALLLQTAAAMRERMPANPVTRDPSPSRLSYRLNRLWLTPLFRRVLTLGVPAFIAAFMVGTFLADPARHAVLKAYVESVYTAFIERSEFRVDTVLVSNVSPALNTAVIGQLGVALPQSSFHLDLAVLRARVEALDAVARANVRLVNNVLEIAIVERRPALVWRSRTGLELIDSSGARVALLSERGARADLPLIAGEGAAANVTEALSLFAAAAPLSSRLRGLVRIGERRWDVVLDRGQRIMLPEVGARAALERAIALEQSQDLLSRDVQVVDLRNPARPTLRLAQGVMETLYQIRQFEPGVDLQ